MVAVRKLLGSEIADWTFRAIALVSLIAALTVGAQQYRLANCLARYTEASNASTAARAAAAEGDRRAQDQMYKAIAESPRSAVAQLQQYLETRRQADAQRAANPVPPQPTCR